MRSHSGNWYQQPRNIFAFLVDGKKSETVCGGHLCFKDQAHARLTAKSGNKCKNNNDNTCYDNNPRHELCTQYRTRQGVISKQYSYDECLEQCNDKIPRCYGFNYNPDKKNCYHMVLPDGETTMCNITAESTSSPYMTMTCNDCPPNNSRRIGCGGQDAGTCPGKQINMPFLSHAIHDRF